MKRLSAATLNVYRVLWPKWHKHRKQSTVLLYCKTVNYLVETYATDYEIAETDVDMIPCPQAQIKSPKENVEAILNNALHCHRVYKEYVLKSIFLKAYRAHFQQYDVILGLEEEYYSTRLTRHQTSLTKLHCGSAVQTRRIMKTSWKIAQGIVDAEVVTLMIPKRVSPPLLPCRLVLRLKEEMSR